VKKGGSLSFLVGTISNVLIMEIGWTDVGSCAHSNTSSAMCINYVYLNGIVSLIFFDIECILYLFIYFVEEITGLQAYFTNPAL
jgi:hypothetical protein